MGKYQIDTNELGFVLNAQYHDLIFSDFFFDGENVKLKLRNEVEDKTLILCKNVKYLEIGELVPNGIVMTLYHFKMKECPSHLLNELDFGKAKQYLDINNDFEIFYGDGSMGFEILVICSSVFVESL